MTDQPKWAIVPVELTRDMEYEIDQVDFYLADYSAMLAAAPEPPAIVEALEPFARLADCYDPPEGDDDHSCWDQAAQPTLGDLRRARAELAKWYGRNGGEL
jgi:hypothetical protein